MPPTIFIDLDDCLIHSVFGLVPTPFRHPIDLGLCDDGTPNVYSSTLRPNATFLLAKLRSIAPLHLLTTSVLPYASAHNKAFGLGFLPGEIHSRNDFIMEVPTAYGGRTTTVTKTRISPGSVLLDNLPPTEHSSSLKMSYLGIPTKNYLQISEFTGLPEEALSLEETLSLELRVRCLLFPSSPPCKILERINSTLP